MEEEIIVIENDEEQEIITIEEDIEYIKPTTQEKTIIPTEEDQIVVPDDGIFALSKVNVKAVTNEIDENIKSENIKKDVSILGVQGNVEELKGTKIEIIKNGTYIPEEPNNAYTEVNVNVSADVSEYFSDTLANGTSSAGGFADTLMKTPKYETVSNNLSYAFYSFKGTEINTNFNTSNVNNMQSMFQNCLNLTELNLSNFNTSSVTNMQNMFSGCNNLTSLNLNSFNTYNVKYMQLLFYNCKKLTSLDLSSFDASNVSSIANAFINCNKLTDLNFMKNLGKGYTYKSNNYNVYTLNVSNSPLTHNSLMSVINNLYDLNLTYDVANGGTLYTQKLSLGATNLAKLTAEEIKIATDKGFSVS